MQARRPKRGAARRSVRTLRKGRGGGSGVWLALGATGPQGRQTKGRGRGQAPGPGLPGAKRPAAAPPRPRPSRKGGGERGRLARVPG